MIRLPEHRNGYWYRTNGTCVKPNSWEWHRYTYGMAFLHLLGYAAIIGGLTAVALGVCQLWIWYPANACWIAGSLALLMLTIGAIQGVAKDITRGDRSRV